LLLVAFNQTAPLSGFFLPSEAGKPVWLKETSLTLIEGKMIRMASASLANGGGEGSHMKLAIPFTIETAVLLATLTLPNHLVQLSSWG
jgi:hypothetical protein